MKFLRPLSTAALVLFTASSLSSCVFNCERCKKKREVHAAAIQHEYELQAPPSLATAPPAQ